MKSIFCFLPLITSVSFCNIQVMTLDKQVENYFYQLNTFAASFEQIDSKDKKCNGKMYISKTNKKPQVRVNYNNGEIQDIIMNGRYISIINRKTKKKKTYSILTTPLYALLSGQLKLSDIKYSITSNNNNVILRVEDSNQIINIKFSIIKQTKNKDYKIIDKLLSWTIDDRRNTTITVTFNEKDYNVGTNARIPDNIFDINTVQ